MSAQSTAVKVLRSLRAVRSGNAVTVDSTT